MKNILRSSLVRALAGALLVSAVDVGAADSERDIVVREQLNREWTGELLTYPLGADEGRCLPGSVRLRGPDGPVSVQLSNVELWPGTEFVKAADVSFVVKALPPRDTQIYTLAYSDAAAMLPPLATDLGIRATDGRVELTTARFGIRVLTGEQTYAEPVPMRDVPGPVLGMRLSDGSWFGGSRLYGAARVKQWASCVTDRGPVFARIETVYTLDDDSTFRVATKLGAGDYAAVFDMHVQTDRLDAGWELVFGGDVRFDEAVLIAGQRNYAVELKRTLQPGSPDPVCKLNCWPGDKWFPDSPSAFRLLATGGVGEMQVAVREPGTWVEPQTEPIWAEFTRWSYKLIEVMWDGWRRKEMPLMVRADETALQVGLAVGRRQWTVGSHTEGEQLLARYQGKVMSLHSPLPSLDRVKDMVLDWPDGEEQRPYLLLSDEKLDLAGQRDPEALADTRNVAALRSMLDSLGTFDLMRHLTEVAARYDALIDSDQVTAEERPLLKAQMAYLGYVGADPFHWSFERGCCSGNPNMTVSRITNQGIVGCALRDHPMGKVWAMHAIDWCKYWLANTTDDSGSWPESSHYARVSWGDYVHMAIVARRAGYYDFFKDPKFKAMALFYERTLTPPDLLRRIHRVVPRGQLTPAVRVGAPYGRGTRGDAWGLSGIVASATAGSDPAFSRIMQWSWRESGFSSVVSHAPAGLSRLYVDPALPTAVPDWRSEHLPALGYILRDDVGSAHEDYLLFIAAYLRHPDGELWPADTGSIAKWFANGQPIGGNFRRIPETSHVMLENRVMLACNWDPAVGDSPESGYVTVPSQDAFTAFSALDYVSAGFDVQTLIPHFLRVPKDAPAFPRRERTGEPPFHWQRQILTVRGDEPGAVDYLVVRDTVRGGQPTQWHFWTLSEKVAASDEAADRAAFLADAPGAKYAPARELKGNRFTALGQFDTDLEYYVAEPADTPRYTLRFGTRGGAYGLRNFNEFQDLLHLQRPDDGSYFVAMFPHLQDEPAPKFETLAEGRVIRVKGTFGTDTCFLSAAPVDVKAGEVACSGTAAVVRDRLSGLVLTLAAPGEVSCREYGLSGTVPARAQISPKALTIDFPSTSMGGEVALRLPGTWRLAGDAEGVSFEHKADRYILALTAAARSARLERTK